MLHNVAILLVLWCFFTAIKVAFMDEKCIFYFYFVFSILTSEKRYTKLF